MDEPWSLTEQNTENKILSRMLLSRFLIRPGLNSYSRSHSVGKLRCTWIPFLLDQKDKGWGGNYFFYAVFFKCWGFPTVLYLTYSVYSGRICVHIMNDWMDRVDFTLWNKLCQNQHLKEHGFPCFTSAHFQASVPLMILQIILGFAVCLKGSESWLKNKKCIHKNIWAQWGGSTYKPAVIDLHPAGSSVEKIWKGV